MKLKITFKYFLIGKGIPEYFYDVIEGNDQLSSHMKWYFDTNISSSRQSYKGRPINTEQSIFSVDIVAAL